MNVTKLNRSGLNVSRLNASLLNAGDMGCMGSKGKETMEDRIMQSMVLWYDLAKQGATNESMAADPRLIDHSGNGHHATCYNFAWSGMSGIGGYAMDFTRLSIMSKENTQVSSTKIEIKSGYEFANGGVVFLNTNSTNIFDFPNYRVKVSGLNSNLIYRYIGEDGDKHDIFLTNGVHDLPASHNSLYATGRTAIGFCFLTASETDIVIEQLPLYSNALVSDGVDDYADVTGLPILTKEKGYTVVAKRKYLDTVSCIACKNKLNQLNGGFIFELTAPTGQYARSFGGISQITIVSDDISYQTSKKYCEQKLVIGDSDDTDTLTLFLLNNLYCISALYSLLIFDRDLTDEEIEWVKTNLMSE
ncbi:MAG TPA: hypothetical protein H9824_05775 [Candidatus Bacteroides pullicola]|uniref:Uncharacterized protein n=1 Tax=Candidatus Bacteroides pullicola TaxID=2838475 RepID=A0A9D2CL90_9BACE|nr:hypothetical protein [Candidatus Bacteroides pullicola]